MKIFICCSKAFYSKIPKIKSYLESKGHKITLPNSYDDPLKEEKVRKEGANLHAKWKGKMIREQEQKIRRNDAILVLNLRKNNQPNYIGGATFLEMYKAYELGKKIYLYNQIPNNILRDEILGFSPHIIDGDLNKIQ
jgi:hypothetical protein